MPGVRELVEDVRLEVLMDDGVRLVVLIDPLRDPDTIPATDGPGATRVAGTEPPTGVPASPALPRIELEVRSESRRVIRVSSHYPFDKVNRRLVFDRVAAHGFRLDVEAGESERWSPGETRTVRLVRFGGAGGEL
jgi:urease subunit gamma/beta